MLQGEQGANMVAVSPDEFQQGMLASAGQKKFQLVHSPLRPAKNNGV
jgi:hypothetical protein